MADAAKKARKTGGAPPGKGGSLHQRITSDIEGRILSGEWPPGHRIPFEVDLAAEYGCARMTVNKVLTQLVKSGLIERRRKAGTFVRQPVGQSAVLQISDIRTEVLALGLAYRHRVAACSRRRPTKAERERLGMDRGDAVLALECLHYAGERPFCHEERLINLAAVPEAADERFTEVAPGSWLLEKVPWSSAEHVIRAVAADEETARALEIPAGGACLVMERRTFMNGPSVTWVRFTYPGNRHRLVAGFSPSQEA